MIIREVTVEALPAFLLSGEYGSLRPKPVTAERALSQHLNPRARPEDTALIIACEGERLLGFAGLLPDFINGNPEWRAFSNSGWWVDPETGGHLALPLFARALQRADHRLFLTDCTVHSKKILEQTGWFHFCPPVKGTTLILRFYLEKAVSRRTPAAGVRRIARWFDRVLNGTLVPLGRLLCFRQEGLRFREASLPDEEVEAFISLHNRQEFTARGAADLEWILRYPWLKKGTEEKPSGYPFSHTTRQFSQQLLMAREEGTLVCVALLSVRDNHATLPCFYAREESVQPCLIALVRRLLDMRADSLTLFQPSLIRCIRRLPLACLLRKKRVRHRALTKELLPLLNQYPHFQDGDGDILFTS